MLRRACRTMCQARPKTAQEFGELAAKLRDAPPEKVIDTALSMYGTNLGISFSGAEDVLLVHYASKTGRPFRVFSLDTGRLHPETYRFFEEVEKRYKINIEYLFPDTQQTQQLVRQKGMFSFFVDGHTECCTVRKVNPLKRHLGTLEGWMTGQRKDQSVTRTEVPLVQIDGAFSSGANTLVKWNPLANVRSRDLWDIIRQEDVPFNQLHNQGFVSIGCEPCTRPTLPGQHEREGRWWWEDAAAKECGLHAQKK